MYIGMYLYNRYQTGRLSSVTLVLRHYCNTVTMTLVSWCRNTKVTLHQIWYTLKYHQFCSKFEKKAFFIGSNLKNHHFPPKIWKKSSIATKIWKTSFLAKFEKKIFLGCFFLNHNFLKKFGKSIFIMKNRHFSPKNLKNHQYLLKFENSPVSL